MTSCFSKINEGPYFKRNKDHPCLKSKINLYVHNIFNVFVTVTCLFNVNFRHYPARKNNILVILSTETRRNRVSVLHRTLIFMPHKLLL